jgi:hypothetical protein
MSDQTAIINTIRKKKGPYHNQYTDNRPHTPPESSQPDEGTIHHITKCQKHLETPKKAQFLGIVEWENSKPPETRVSMSKIIKFCDIPRTTAYRTLQGKQSHNNEPSARRHHNDPTVDEARGRPNKLTSMQVKAVENLLADEGFDARQLSWDELATSMDFDICSKTLKNYMGH